MESALIAMAESEFTSKEIYQLFSSVVSASNTQTEILRQNTEILKSLSAELSQVKGAVTELGHRQDIKDRDDDSSQIKLAEIAHSVKGLGAFSPQSKEKTLVQDLISRDGFWWTVTTVGTSLVIVTGGQGFLELLGKWFGVK